VKRLVYGRQLRPARLRSGGRVMIKNEAAARFRDAQRAGVGPSFNRQSLLPSGDMWVAGPRAIGTKSRDLTQARGSFQDQDTSGRWPVAWRCVAWRRPDREAAGQQVFSE
jgi:hypothetical protein